MAADLAIWSDVGVVALQVLLGAPRLVLSKPFWNACTAFNATNEASASQIIVDILIVLRSFQEEGPQQQSTVLRVGGAIEM